jgi:tripartite ATP-independent transporter DctM subunit
MEWYFVLLMLLGSFAVLMMLGIPLAFAFMGINIVAAYFMWGGFSGILQLIHYSRDAVSVYSMLPLPLFILLGEVLFRSRVVDGTLDAVDKCVGNFPGRLSLLAIASSTIFATVCGVSAGSVAMLGSTLVPEMEKRGYKKSMSLGPVLGGGGLSIMIPPTALGVLFAAIAVVSVGDFLIAIIIPGLLLAILYSAYIIIRCYLQPSVAPVYDVSACPFREKALSVAKYVLPLVGIIFLVTGVIFLGIATPTEAAATGALGAFVLVAFYKRFSWNLIKRSVSETILISGMMLLIIAGATTFSMVLAFSGASSGMIQFVMKIPLPPIFIIIVMMIIILFMGMFFETVSIMMITVPIFFPIVKALGFDPLWFGVMYLLNIEMSVTTPPFGLSLFVMKGVAPPGTTIKDVVLAALPFLGVDLIVMAMMLLFPQIVLWLPGLMG